MTSPATNPAGGLRTAIVVLALGSFFSGAGLRICDGLIPRLAADFHTTPGVAGRVMLTFSLAYALALLAYGPLADRFGKGRLICSALFGSALGSLACAFAPDLDTLVGLRIFWGMAAAGVIPLSMAFIGDAVPYEQRQATLARLLLGTISGMMAGQLAGGLFADTPAGWRGAFLTLAAGYLLVGGVLLVQQRQLMALSGPAKGPRMANGAQLLSVLRLPWARRILALSMAEGAFLLGPLAYLPADLHQRFGIAVSAAAALVALYAVGGLVYAISAPRIVRRWGERRMVQSGGWLMGAGFLALFLSPQAWLAGPIALAIGFGTYLFHNTLQTNATQMAPAARGTAMGLFAFCLFFGQSMGVALAGFAFDRLGRGPLLLVPAVALSLAGWAFARALRRRAAS